MSPLYPLLCARPALCQDSEYRERRKAIVEAGSKYQYGHVIPPVKYSPEELATWGVVYRKLKDYSQKYAVKQVRLTWVLRGGLLAAPVNVGP